MTVVQKSDLGPPSGVWAVPDLIYGLTRTAINPNDMYSVCKEIDGYPGPGTFPLISQRADNFYRVWNRQPYYEPASSYDKIKIASTKNYVLHSQGVSKGSYGFLITFHIFESIYSAPLGVVPIPKPNEKYKGIHAVAVTGWGKGMESLLFINTWGKGWGNRGWGEISREYLDKYLVEGWIMSRCRVGPTRQKWDRLLNARGKEFSKVWLLENPRWMNRFKHNGDKHRLVRYETISVEYACPVFIFEIRNGYGLRLAWMHLAAPNLPAPFLITELIVFPSFRRLGYGSILESIASDMARRWDSKTIEIQFHDADAQVRVRMAGMMFGNKCGYTWKCRDVKYPRLQAIGEKTL